MATEICMPDPVCLIENVKGRLKTNEKALEILSSIKQPVVVVAIVGLYRTGKSYLMNKLAGKKTGFSLGSTVQSHTKGIWIWCVPHPQKPDHSLVLLDTEGLGDVEKGDNQNDCWIFALAVLLSSTFVYNSIGTINQQAMDHLHYVTELTKLIRAKSSPNKDEDEDSADFMGFFPDFVWILRDMTLKLEVDGQCLTADAYLHKSLMLKEGQSEEVEKYNLPRLCIRKFFPKKTCFALSPPTEWKKLSLLETLNDNELDSDFGQQVKEFCSYIFKYSKTKTLPGGLNINGSRLKRLVQTYVEAISSGDVPCMENAVLSLAQIENSATVKKAMADYEQQMGQKVQLPTETLQELLDLHKACEKEALKVFFNASFKDEGRSFQMQLESQLENRWNDFRQRNVDLSSDRCSALIQDIFGPLEEALKQDVYFRPGGYYLFNQELQMLTKKYLEEPRKGLQADEVLHKYLQTKEAVTASILQADQKLTEKEREIEVERTKAEFAQATAKLMEETQKKNRQLEEQREKSYQEHMKQLNQKMESEKTQLIEEQKRTLAIKLQEQELYFKKEISEERIKFQKQIQNLEMQNTEISQKLDKKEKKHEKHVKQLTEKMEMHRQLAEDQKNKMNQKLEEQGQKFNQKINRMEEKHRREVQEIKNSGCLMM